eukprot:7057860-Pyramimonas_sp.AAC.1
MSLWVPPDLARTIRDDEISWCLQIPRDLGGVGIDRAISTSRFVFRSSLGLSQHMVVLSIFAYPERSRHHESCNPDLSKQGGAWVHGEALLDIRQEMGGTKRMDGFREQQGRGRED